MLPSSSIVSHHRLLLLNLMEAAPLLVRVLPRSVTAILEMPCMMRSSVACRLDKEAAVGAAATVAAVEVEFAACGEGSVVVAVGSLPSSLSPSLSSVRCDGG